MPLRPEPGILSPQHTVVPEALNQLLISIIAAINAGGGGGGGSTQRFTRGAAWSGSGVAIVASVADIVYIEVPASGTIRSVTMLGAVGTGSASAEVWKTPYSGALPTSANKISGGTPPTITSGVKYQDSTLLGWTTAVTAGDILAFKLLTSSVFSWVSITLDIQ